ncbi:MAG: hypothetical protein EBW87_05440 [Burkholderiaceae bacterium]|nr:hypothetical protein [Burkholderiaceae bacterium]
MGLFNIVKAPDYQVKQGDTEQMVFIVKGYDLSGYSVSFKGVSPTGVLNKATGGQDITKTAFANNEQTITISFATADFKALQGTMKYELQVTLSGTIYTIIEGNIIIKAEIIK